MLDVLCVYIMNELYHMVISTGIRLLWFIWSSTQFSQVKYYFRLLMLRAIRIRCKSTSCQQHFLYCSLFGFFSYYFCHSLIFVLFGRYSWEHHKKITFCIRDKIWSIKTTLRAFLSKKKYASLSIVLFTHFHAIVKKKFYFYQREREIERAVLWAARKHIHFFDRLRMFHPLFLIRTKMWQYFLQSYEYINIVRNFISLMFWHA